MNDLIDRQAVFDVVLQAAQKTPSRFYVSGDAMMGYRAALQLIYHGLKAISPARQSSSCNHEKGGQPEPEEPFDGCSDCIHSDDSLELCIMRRCKHAAKPVECFEPKQPERKRGEWKPWRCDMYKCSECGYIYTELSIDRCEANYCPHCGAKMEVNDGSD